MVRANSYSLQSRNFSTMIPRDNIYQVTLGKARQRRSRSSPLAATHANTYCSQGPISESVNVNEAGWFKSIEARRFRICVGTHTAGDEQIVEMHLRQGNLTDGALFIPREDIDRIARGARQYIVGWRAGRVGLHGKAHSIEQDLHEGAKSSVIEVEPIAAIAN